MAIPVLKLPLEAENVYSPLSGKPAYGKNGPNTRDPDLLFVFHGGANEGGYLSKRVVSALATAGKDPSELSPETVCRRLNLPGAVCLKIDTGWNGVDWVAWAKPESA